VLGEGALLAVGGASTGFAAALTLGRSLSAVLYQVGPTDPVALTLAPTVILAVALVAALVPAWRPPASTPVRYLGETRGTSGRC
jgi:putative ABC transport system permease protein